MATALFKTIDGTPEKNIFRGMIADYDLQTGICELVDNALDLWVASKRKAKLKVEITLDTARQLIIVKDNAGGVKEADLRLLIAPGASRDNAEFNLIGIFGVGGKRAGVALGELVEIRTRHQKLSTFKISLDNEWLEKDTWDIAYSDCSQINMGSTIVEISKLRQPFSHNDVDTIRDNLGEIYNWYIEQGCEIVLNDSALAGTSFDVWSYPPDFRPRHLEFTIKPDNDRALSVVMDAGLIGDRNEVGENYGVYIYCNNRLIVKEMRTRDVGYHITSEAGRPHPDASLCRVIVRLEGNAELMPWNSSKSDVNIAHPSFKQLRSNVIALTTYFSKLSRALKKNWDEGVFSHDSGEMEVVDPAEIADGHKLILPKLPRVRKLSYVEQLRQLNLKKMDATPQTIGLIEAMGMVDILSRQKLETRNRAALILLDSNFEIALKEYIVTNPRQFPPATYTNRHIQGLFNQRTAVIKEVQAKVPKITPMIVSKANFYYGLRNKLIHERTTVPVSDREIADYRGVIEQVLKTLFAIRFPKAT